METIQKKSSILLKDIAKQQLSGNYNTVVPAYFIMEFLISLPLQLLQNLLNLNSSGGMAVYMAGYVIISLLSAVFVLGQNHIYLSLVRRQDCQLSHMWHGFHNHADKAILASLIVFLKTAASGIPFFICSCIVIATRNYYIAPLAGITCCLFLFAAAYFQLTYSQVFYLMLDFPEESAKELLTHSARLMKGNRLRFFYLRVSFLGLLILGIMSLSIGLLWVMPYMNMTMAGFYEDIRSLEQE